MNKSILIAFLLIFSTSIAFAQKNVNNYKYIIVPKQYEFQKSEDKYQINSLTKFLFERAGFIAYFSTDKFPEELANNGCMALKAIVKNNSGMLSTKLNIELVDCYNNIVFSTSEAKSKEKEYKKAYQAAIRKAFEDIEALNYSYNSKNISEAKNIQVKAEKQENITVAEVEPKVEKEINKEKSKKRLKFSPQLSHDCCVLCCSYCCCCFYFCEYCCCCCLCLCCTLLSEV